MKTLEQMAKEAGLHAYQKLLSPPIQCYEGRHEAWQQFAAMVARECAGIAESTTEQGAPDLGCETKAYATAEAIRERFGIKGGQK